MSTNYTREGSEIFADEGGDEPVSVARFLNTGKLRMQPNQKHHREAVEAFLKESGAEIKPSEDEDVRVTHPLHSLNPQTGEVKRLEGKGIPPCPPEDPSAGDKTPAVVRWWHTHHPEGAAQKYAGRKFKMPTL